MELLEHELLDVTAQKRLPAIIIAAANKDRSLNYMKKFGYQSLSDDSTPVTSESTMCLSSATKIVTCVAAMQCVERGLLELDTDITMFVPEWKDAVISKGFEEENGKPILVKASHKITLRQLLTHTSGITSLENEKIMAYYKSQGHDRADVIQRYFMSDDVDVQKKALGEIRGIMGRLTVEPLIFEPGTEWSYGQGTDWAGQLIERVTHMTLEEYCQQNIFAPLSMTHTTYRPLDHPSVLENLIAMSARNPDGTISNVDSIYPLESPMDIGGSNLYTSPSDFITFLTSLLHNDGKLLCPETTDLLFNYRLPDKIEGFAKFKKGNAKEYFEESMVNEDDDVDHCLGGLINLQDLKGGRKKGSVSWMGATRCYWWVDRVAGICGFYGSQMMGMGDGGFSDRTFARFERAVYESYGKDV